MPSFPGPYFSAFGLNTEIYGVNLRIQSEYGKIRTRKTPNADTFYAVFYVGAIVRRCSVKKGFLNFSQNSPENTCAGVTF